MVVDAKVSLDAFLDPDLDEQTQAQRLRPRSPTISRGCPASSTGRPWAPRNSSSCSCPPNTCSGWHCGETGPAADGLRPQGRPGHTHHAHGHFAQHLVGLAAGRDGRSGTSGSAGWTAGPRPPVDHEQPPHPAGQKSSATRSGYNQFIGSLDSRVMPAARRLAQMAAPEAEIIELAEVDLRPRAVAVPQPGLGEPDVRGTGHRVAIRGQR